ncbi:hypothetical protein ACQ4LE_010528 [Meloidogyne hapla]
MVQQKQQFKAISLELLVDIFKAVSGYPNIFIKESEKINDLMNTSKIDKQPFVLKIIFTENLLISSSIVNIFCKEVLQKRKKELQIKLLKIMEEERELQQQRINLQIAEQQERDIRQQKIEIQNRIAELEQKVKKRKEGQGTSGTSNLVANESCNPQVFNYSSGSFGVSAGTFFQNSHQNYQSSSQMPFNLSGPVSLYGDGSGCSTSVLGDRPCHQANIPGTSQPFYGSYPQFPGGNSNDLETLQRSTSDTGDGNFRCDFPGCGKVYKTMGGLKCHKAKIHREMHFEEQ